MPDTSVSSCTPLVTFKLPPWCWSSEGVSLNRWMPVWVPQEELLRAPVASSTNSIPSGFLIQNLWGLSFLALESWAAGPGVDLGLLAPKISLSNFYPHRCGASPFHVYTPPTSLGGCGFFNSIVVRLPFNLISDVPEWWLFYILVVILMWLCEEVSHVWLHRHLDQKLACILFLIISPAHVLFLVGIGLLQVFCSFILFF